MADPEDMRYYKMDIAQVGDLVSASSGSDAAKVVDKLLTIQNLRNFIDKYLAGNMEPTLNSEEDSDKNNIKEEKLPNSVVVKVVGTSFNKL